MLEKLLPGVLVKFSVPLRAGEAKHASRLPPGSLSKAISNPELAASKENSSTVLSANSSVGGCPLPRTGKYSRAGRAVLQKGMLSDALLPPRLLPYFQVLEKCPASTEGSKRRERARREQEPAKKWKGLFLEPCGKRRGVQGWFAQYHYRIS